MEEMEKPAGENHVALYHIDADPHDYAVTCACPICYERTQRLLAGYWTSEPVIQGYFRSTLKKYRVVRDQGWW